MTVPCCLAGVLWGPVTLPLRWLWGAQRSFASTSGLRHTPQQVCETAVLLAVALFALPLVAVCHVLHPLLASRASAFCAQWSFASASVPEPWPQVSETAVLLSAAPCARTSDAVLYVLHPLRVGCSHTAHSVPPGPLARSPPPCHACISFVTLCLAVLWVRCCSLVGRGCSLVSRFDVCCVLDVGPHPASARR